MLCNKLNNIKLQDGKTKTENTFSGSRAFQNVTVYGRSGYSEFASFYIKMEFNLIDYYETYVCTYSGYELIDFKKLF